MTEHIDLDESLPETQPADEPQTANNYIPQITPSPSYWGRLHSLRNGLPCCDLVKNTITVGKKDCSLNISKEHVEKGCFNLIDDVHFKLERITTRNCLVKVKLIDLSECGVFVNGRKLGLGGLPPRSKERVLQNNDLIALPKDKRGDHYNVFVYVDAMASEEAEIPAVVTMRYEVTFRLGSGTFGEVHLTFNKESGLPSAMKTIPVNYTIRNEDKCKEKLLNEMKILKSLNHPHIIKLLDVMECDSRTYMFMEFMGGKDLSDKIITKGRLEEDMAKLIFYQLSLGIKHLHDNQIIHRDVKPANVLLATLDDETIVKLADFGLSKVLESTIHMKTKCGTRLYAAPELFPPNGQALKYTSLVDIWSMGVLLFVSLSGTEPFETTPHLMELHIINGLYICNGPKWKSISVFAKNLIDRMLEVNPQNRIHIEEVLKDRWLQDKDMLGKMEKLYSKFGYSF